MKKCMNSSCCFADAKSNQGGIKIVFITCKKCNSATYCSESCLKKDSINHMKDCAP